MKISIMEKALLKGVLTLRIRAHEKSAARCTTKAAETHLDTAAHLQNLLDKVNAEIPTI